MFYTKPMQEATIQLGVWGTIVAAKDPTEKGWFVKIDAKTGKTGIYILTVESLDGNGQVYDAWVEKVEGLNSFFREGGWSVEWFDAATSSQIDKTMDQKHVKL